MLRALHRIKLTESERISARSHIATFMQSYPAHANVQGTFTIQRSLFIRISPVIAGGLVIVLAIGGTASAAQASLPGDVLYPVKISMEKMQQSLTTSQTAKAELHIAFAEKRLREAEQLITNNSFTTSTKAIIKQNLSDQAGTVASAVTSLAKNNKLDDALSVASSFDAVVSAHDSILERLSAKEDADTSDVQDVVNQHNQDVTEVKDEILPQVIALSQPKANSAANTKRFDAVHKIYETRTSIEQNKKKIDSQSFNDASSQLQTAQDLVDAGNSSMSKGAPNDAYTKFQDAHRMAQQAQLLVEIPSILHLKDQLEGKYKKNGKGSQGKQQTTDSEYSTSSVQKETPTVNILQQRGNVRARNPQSKPSQKLGN